MNRCPACGRFLRTRCTQQRCCDAAPRTPLRLSASHLLIVHALASGKNRTADIAAAVQIPLPQLWGRLAELRRARVVESRQVMQRGVHGRPPKLYRLACR